MLLQAAQRCTRPPSPGDGSGDVDDGDMMPMFMIAKMMFVFFGQTQVIIYRKRKKGKRRKGRTGM